MKKSVVGVFGTHDRAAEIIRTMSNSKFNRKDLTIIGRAEEIDGDVKLPSSSNETNAEPAAIGSIIGAVTGALTGIGIFAVPGLGFIYGAGALIGAIAGFDFGLITGGLVSLAETLVEDEHKHSLAEYLEHKNHLVIYTGTDKDKAEQFLKDHHAIEVFH